ncbi:MAG TPA: peptide ABC transporter substrate-binding protein [Aliidongia sp.]|nr:peptide ABC transporter substrate-binding protein [Aliidongia sp.]
MRRFLAIIPSALLCLSSVVPPAARAEEPAILRFGNGSEPATLDPGKSDVQQDLNIETDLFEGLVTLDADTNIRPAAAESWKVSDDGLIYTFTLRPDLQWSNGDPVTAEDFAFSFRRIVDPATGVQYTFLLYPIRNAEDIVAGRIKDPNALGVRAIDARTLEITLRAPTAYFVKMLAAPKFLPVHPDSVRRFGSSYSRAGNLVSNGPFMLKEWTPQSRVVVVRNPHFHGAAAVKLSEIDYLPIENENEELKRYRAGEVDVTWSVPRDQISMVRGSMAEEFRSFPFLAVYYAGLNLEQPPFKDNPMLRQALAMVVDREAIVEKIMKTGETPAYGWIPPGLPGYEQQHFPWESLSMADRIIEAKRLYQEAGYGPGHPAKFELRYNTSANHKAIMIALASMWKQALGAEVTLANEEFKALLEERKQKKITQAFRGTWSADYPDPFNFFEVLQSNSGLNDMGYANPDYDALIGEAARTLDPQERMKLLEQAERMVLTDLPMVPVYFSAFPHMVKPYVQGYHPNVLGQWHSMDISLLPH